MCLASGASCRVSLSPESSVHQLRAEAQRRLGRRGLRLAVAEAEEVTLSPGEMGIARTAQESARLACGIKIYPLLKKCQSFFQLVFFGKDLVACGQELSPFKVGPAALL